jgi:hypothetical protein
MSENPRKMMRKDKRTQQKQDHADSPVFGVLTEAY